MHILQRPIQLFTMSNAGANLSWSDLMDDAWPSPWRWPSGAEGVLWGQGPCRHWGKELHPSWEGQTLCSRPVFLEDSSVLCVKGVLCPQVMHALRELTGSLSVLIEMVVYCCFCNEHFSFTVLHFIKVHTKPGQACVPLVFLSSFGHPVSCNSTTEQSAQWVGFGGGVGV